MSGIFFRELDPQDQCYQWKLHMNTHVKPTRLSSRLSASVG
jgi:hypothetical protein